MKKAMLIVSMVIVMVAMLVGCGKETNTDSKEEPSTIGTLVVELYYPNGEVEILEYPLVKVTRTGGTTYYEVVSNEEVVEIVAETHVKFRETNRVFIGTANIYIK